jgi:hypothetical protein
MCEPRVSRSPSFLSLLFAAVREDIVSTMPRCLGILKTSVREMSQSDSSSTTDRASTKHALRMHRSISLLPR